MKKLIEQRDIILNDFDFKKVKKVMTSLDWVWVDENQMKYHPTIDDLRKVAGFCLDNVIKSKDEEGIYCAGGFEALKINGVLELRFIVEMNNSLSKIL